MKYKRIFLIVLDSLGIGEAKDADLFHDIGSNTLKHICEHVNGLYIPTLEELGLGNLGSFKGINPLPNNLATIARLEELSNGKDTMTGHWEMMGIHTKTPFKTFTDTGFPIEFIHLFEEKTKRKCIGNYAASGTKILDDYGEHQINTGDWIVYTSADSVFQIAANEEIIPLSELYNACQIARELLMDEKWKVGRVIARPYIGTKRGEFIRTANRHDWALEPSEETVLDKLQEKNYDVIGIGKIPDIFANKGITRSIKSLSNADGMTKTIELALFDKFCGLAFLNLVDFDAVYGHRRNPEGYAKAIIEFDNQLKDLLKAINDDDLLIITADHGNDPTFQGTDHTRENVPLIMYSKKINKNKNLGILNNFGVIGATIAENFSVDNPGIGFSLLKEL